ncbi:MAG: phosphatidylglycerophosphatase A family protein [Planctomycetota bacterium]|jgi:phosphatidylglycerophosphatase A
MPQEPAGRRERGAADTVATRPLSSIPPLTGRAAAAVRLLGSFLGAGLLPRAPGTWGSLAALVLYAVGLVVSGLRPQVYGTLGCLLMFLLFSIASLSLGRHAERVAGQRDPTWFVLDEMAGVFLALFGLATYNFAFAGLAFLLFRLFDALKVAGVGWVEKRFGGAVGILLDDLVAASLANLLVRLVLIPPLLHYGVVSEAF